MTPHSRRRAMAGMLSASRPSTSASWSAASTICARVREPRGRRVRRGLTRRLTLCMVHHTVRLTQTTMSTPAHDAPATHQRPPHLDLPPRWLLAFVCLGAGIAPLAARWLSEAAPRLPYGGL